MAASLAANAVEPVGGKTKFANSLKRSAQRDA
jgi:hypothetical protein